MWRQVALPVIVVALSWLTVSGSTNFYLQWLDNSYQQVFNQNVASMHAASLLQQEVWQLHAEACSLPAIAIPTGTSGYVSSMWIPESPLATLRDRAVTPDEAATADALTSLLRQYRSALEGILLVPRQPETTDQTLDRDRLYELAGQVSERADHIREINDALLEAANARRSRISAVVLWARSLAITLVPALGIALGWWTALRLQRTVARIQVTLHDPSLDEPGLLGTVQIGGGSDLASIHKQVEVVVDRLRRTGDELQLARQEVVRAERLAAIGGLAAGVAHELRNPLTSVKLLLQHAAGCGGEAVIAAPRIALILDEIERMEATIQGLIDFSASGTPAAQAARHSRYAPPRHCTWWKAVSTSRASWPRRCARRFARLCRWRPAAIAPVFVNLLINGIEAMPQGGSLLVTLAPDPIDGCLTVRIQDSGVGIPDELMPRLFEPFATAKERGTGLGLAVSRRIIEEHGGTIAAHRRAPHGTIFEVRLPAAAAVSAEPVGAN